MKIYLVFDKKAKDFVSVFTAVNDEAAERSFLMLLTGPRNIFTDFPEDFSVYALADLTANGNTIKVAAPGNDDLAANGFKVDSYELNCPMKDGADYDKRYLALISQDRLNAYKESEVKTDEN